MLKWADMYTAYIGDAIGRAVRFSEVAWRRHMPDKLELLQHVQEQAWQRFCAKSKFLETLVQDGGL